MGALPYAGVNRIRFDGSFSAHPKVDAPSDEVSILTRTRKLASMPRLRGILGWCRFLALTSSTQATGVPRDS
jgi:hypothetical protein